ncbi:DUF742 domain-containing protein [Actinomadura sp. KC216]|uniref:DUF742 domain-containing protein n=1 Tax=Actinomadura sp. KC216 TaxID=2530370 RepID=UPI001049319D|nr:DUF742 domain-containing protein [Actinomadura sp. KC216]TDB88842.1 DUF742 domain-containing protein [Actinomadura sp. KC216]
MRREPPGRTWITQDVPDVVRPYMVTGNRTRPRHRTELDTVLTATTQPVPDGTLQPEAAHALLLCRKQQRTLAEVAATIKQPALVTKIIVSDLIDQGALAAHPHADLNYPSRHLLEDVLAGLTALDAT